MRPAVHFNDVASPIEVIVNSVSIGDEAALIVREDFVDGRARVVTRVLEEDVTIGGDETQT